MDLGFWPRVSRACCCMTLRVGALVIGYASLVLSVTALTLICVSLYAVVNYMNTHQNNINTGTGGSGTGSGSGTGTGTGTGTGHSPEETRRVSVGLYITHAYFMLVYLYYTVVSILLLVGVHRNKARLVRHSFFAGLILLLFAASVVILNVIFFGLITATPALIWSMIVFYCLIVIRSTCLEMEDNNKPRVYEMQPMFVTSPAAAASSAPQTAKPLFQMNS